MNKIFLALIIFFLSIQINFADDIDNIENTHQKCEQCEIEDDEYCYYNQCYFNNHYRKMKKILCLTLKQEIKIDNIYQDFKSNMENLFEKHKTAKNKLLEMIECDCCKKEIKKQVTELKEIDNFIKVKIKDYKEDVLEELCKTQRKDFKKFIKKEKKKIKKISKYAKIYKYPCTNCCKK